jgi:hypothetical protein
LTNQNVKLPRHRSNQMTPTFTYLPLNTQNYKLSFVSYLALAGKNLV